jgi:hypothetical protein
MMMMMMMMMRMMMMMMMLMSNVFLQVRSLLSTCLRSARGRRCFLVIIIVVLVKVIIVLPIIAVINHHRDVSSLFSSLMGSKRNPGTSSDPLSTWRPDEDILLQMYVYLNVPEEEVDRYLPPSLKSPETLGNDVCKKEEDESDEDGASGCAGSSTRVDILFLVHSSPLNFRRRRRMRNTIFNQEFFVPYRVSKHYYFCY